MKTDEISECVRPRTLRRRALSPPHWQTQTFQVTLRRETFECDVTYCRVGASLRWTLHATGDGRFRSGIARTGATSILGVPPDDVSRILRNDVTVALQAEVLFHATTWVR